MVTATRPRPRQRQTTAKRLAHNVQQLRIKKFKTVQKACAVSGWTIPRWYRLEQGNHPGMVGVVLDELAALFRVPPESLVK